MRWFSIRWVTYPLAVLLALVLLGVAIVAAVSALAWPKLPPLDLLTDYRPRVPLRIYSADGFLIDEFGTERRDVVKFKNVPDKLKNAILAAEDKNFYEHMGVDLIGMSRAVLKNMRSSSRGQGASTITMQVARNFFLSREKSYTRKFYEILLSFKIEQELSKEQIFEIYLNQIFLGQRAYGFKSAAKIYFKKEDLNELSIAQCAMLAGLPQQPSEVNPVRSPNAARKRQQWVLGRMLEAGFITNAQYNKAIAESNAPSAVATSAEEPMHADYIAEIARQIAYEQFGEQAYERGLKVITTIRRDEQEAAYTALRKGVVEYDRRHGFRGAERQIEFPDSGDKTKFMDEELIKSRDYGDFLAAVVVNASPQSVTVYRDAEKITINGKGLSFASAFLRPNASSHKSIRAGSIVRIRKEGEKGWVLTQLPQIEAAFISVDPHDGTVHALVGGFDFNRNKFNHVTQAGRQPGSSFKPFIYSASLERGWAPGSIIVDEPVTFMSGKTQWQPHNYDNKFSGNVTMRHALARSKNIPAVRVLDAIGPDYAQKYVTRFGFDKEHHPPYLTMALGAGAVTPLEMASAYSVFANGGYRIRPYVVAEIRDSNDKVVARVEPLKVGDNAPRVIDSRNAWVMNSMLQDVVRAGTAVRAGYALGRKDLAGKTGTTNDFRDAWFCGYTPNLVGVSWVGFSQPRKMGSGETGGHAALPIWIDYMKVVLAGQPVGEFPAKPNGLSGSGSDVYYSENKPPAPPEQPKSAEDEGGSGVSDWFDALFKSPKKAPAPVEQR